MLTSNLDDRVVRALSREILLRAQLKSYRYSWADWVYWALFSVLICTLSAASVSLAIRWVDHVHPRSAREVVLKYVVCHPELGCKDVTDELPK